jgi:hypothetical protein
VESPDFLYPAVPVGGSCPRDDESPQTFGLNVPV